MKIDQSILEENGVEEIVKNGIENKDQVRLVLVFGENKKIAKSDWFEILSSRYINADIISCSSEDLIVEERVVIDTITFTAIQFDKTKVETSITNIKNHESSFELGKSVLRSINNEELTGVLIFSDGQLINGSQLIDGINAVKPKNTIVTGGLAADGENFSKTLVGINSLPEEGNVVIVGLYGENISIGYGSKGGWDHFGPKRKVTKSEGNTLYELDNQNALALYKKYLGDKASELPGAALFFPIALQIENSDEVLIRTILNIDEENQAMIFAGDIPEGGFVQLMRTNFEHLIDGAREAAVKSLKSKDNQAVELAILVSCIGRKMVLGQIVDEEIENIMDVFGEETALTGFYSYGEIAPLSHSKECQLHNETMTITTLSES